MPATPRQYTLSSTDIHDLTCFVVHKLLLWSPPSQSDNYLQHPALSESVRHALVLYMLIVQGPTYFTHAGLQYATVLKLRAQLEHAWFPMLPDHGSFAIWLLSVGMVAADGMPECHWFTIQALAAADALELRTWGDIVERLRDIVWLDSQAAELLFKSKWQDAWTITAT
jgi:hypothetical protein